MGVSLLTAPHWHWLLDMDVRDGRTPAWHAGVEYKLPFGRNEGNNYSWRAGIDDGTYTAGVGFQWQHFKLDYAFRNSQYDVLDASHVLSIGYSN
jgi:hypothetical protein